MLIVALETVTRRGSLALWDDGRVVSFESDDARSHAERLPSELVSWLDREGRRTLADVDLFAVVSGPGSFTGLRVGIAAVQGLALAGDRRVVPIPTLEALAVTIKQAEAGTTIVPCLDGQRAEVFLAAFEQTSDPDPRQWPAVITPGADRPETFASTLARLKAGRPVSVGGSGANKYGTVFTAALPDVRLVTPTAPLAEAAVRLAAIRQAEAVAPHALRPIYLRRPDAEIARDRARQAAPPAFRVRRADLSTDLQAVEALQRQTFTNPWGADAIRWELENSDVARLYVLEAPGGHLVAYCACWMVFDELHINSLAVDQAWRRHGAARTLLAHVLTDAVRSGAKGATLEVRRSNEPACALYQGLGFSVGGVRRDYYQDPREDALILWNRRLESFAPGGR